MKLQICLAFLVFSCTLKHLIELTKSNIHFIYVLLFKSLQRKNEIDKTVIAC